MQELFEMPRKTIREDKNQTLFSNLGKRPSAPVSLPDLETNTQEESKISLGLSRSVS